MYTFTVATFDSMYGNILSTEFNIILPVGGAYHFNEMFWIMTNIMKTMKMKYIVGNLMTRQYIIRDFYEMIIFRK